ncbi:MAG: NUDIX hydrolase [Nanoarchaeota archaeon]|nr:NUDIX hydrolase [Nanoarchaeota archaeon]
MKKWKVLNSKKIIANDWITIEKHKCDIGQGKVIKDYYIIKKRDYVILVIEDRNKIIFLKQYRHGIGNVVLNLPMGLIDKEECSEMAAKRELLEETGYVAGKLDYIGEFFLAPSYINTRAHVFYANRIRKKSIENVDPYEGNISLISIPKNELKKLLEDKMIKDSSTLTALLMVNSKLNLF